MSELSPPVPVRHGRVELAVPGDWQDRSTLAFVSPLVASPSIGPTVAHVEPYRSTLTATFEALPDGVTSAEVLLERMDAELARAGVQAPRLAAGAMEIAGRPASFVERRLELQGVLVRQLVAAVLVEGAAILFTASVQESRRAELASLKDVIAAAKIS